MTDRKRALEGAWRDWSEQIVRVNAPMKAMDASAFR